MTIILIGITVLLFIIVAQLASIKDQLFQNQIQQSFDSTCQTGDLLRGLGVSESEATRIVFERAERQRMNRDKEL